MGETVHERAPAKINLALAVTGRRPDNYHLLDTIVVFADIADGLTALPESRTILEVAGRFAGAIGSDADNSVLRAAALLDEEARRLGKAPAGVRIKLLKHLPVAAGLGGGSADAAACLRLLDRLWNVGLGRDRLASLGEKLGADVPMCVHGRALRARGIGEQVEMLADMPSLDLVLVNPGVALSTADVFSHLDRRNGPALPPVPRLRSADELAAFLARTGNDLERSARRLAPVIGEVLESLHALPGCLLARMSGSGATCFALFADRGAAVTAAAQLAAERPGWWVVATRTQ